VLVVLELLQWFLGMGQMVLTQFSVVSQPQEAVVVLAAMLVLVTMVALAVAVAHIQVMQEAQEFLVRGTLAVQELVVT
jgi:hypothetical protein